MQGEYLDLMHSSESTYGDQGQNKVSQNFINLVVLT